MVRHDHQLFVGGLMSYLRYLCLFGYSGVQHILCCIFFYFFFFVLCTLCRQFVWIVHFWLPLLYSLMFIYLPWTAIHWSIMATPPSLYFSLTSCEGLYLYISAFLKKPFNISKSEDEKTTLHYNCLLWVCSSPPLVSRDVELTCPTCST